MENFDYYVSGAKVERQVPRFEAKLISAQGLETFSVNQALNNGPFILIFGDESSIVSQELDIPTYLVVRDDASKVSVKNTPIILDTNLAIAESFGVLNEKTGLFIPSMFGIKASGQLGFKLEGVDVNTLPTSLFKSLINSLNN